MSVQCFKTTVCKNCEHQVSYYIYSKTVVFCICKQKIGEPTGHKLKLVN